MADDITDDFAKAWIKNYESGKDTFRIGFLEPYFRSFLSQHPTDSILDVGAGWGELIGCLLPDQKYHGIEPSSGLRSYVKKHWPSKKITAGFLPNNIAVPTESVDTTVCSMVLHHINNVEEGIKTLYSKTRKNGTVLVVSFSDKGLQTVRKDFVKIEKNTADYIEGSLTLPSGIIVNEKLHFHTEETLRKIMQQYGSISYEYIGPLFIAIIGKKN